jgi:RimJ/RimL family protein N-acetyltransferase
MAVRPLENLVRSPSYRLTPLARAQADEIAGWPRSNGEAFWLAPRTPPPITGQKILNWACPGRQQLVLCDVGPQTAIAYGELNVLNAETSEYWIGHLIVNPLYRGQGVGTALTRLLVQRAFTMFAARRVTLVVFPENKAAVRCYEQVGFRREGYETHYFPVYMRKARLARMAIQSA